MLEGSSITNISIDFEWNGVPNFNYVYISSFNRWYFVEDIRTIRYNLWNMKLSVDVLMSYKEKIYDSEAFVARNESIYNEMIYDNCIPMEQGIDIEEHTYHYTPFNPVQGKLTLNQNGDIYIRDNAGGAYDKADNTLEFSYDLANSPCRVAIVGSGLGVGLEGADPESLSSSKTYNKTNYSRKWFDNEDFPRYYSWGERIVVGNFRTIIDLFKRINTNNLWDILFNNVNATASISKILIFPMYLKVGNGTGEKWLKFVKSGDDKIVGVKAFPFFEDEYGERVLAKVFEKDIYGKFSDFRDFGNYTKIKAYLPFLGTVEIPTDYVMGKKLVILLTADYHTGYGMYYITYTDQDDDLTNYDNCKIISKYKVKLAVEITANYNSSAENTRNAIFNTLKTVLSVGFAVTGHPVAATVTSAVGSVVTTDTSESRGRGDYKGARMKTLSTSESKRVETTTTETTSKHIKGSASIANEIVGGIQSALYPTYGTPSVESNEPYFESLASYYVKLFIETPRYNYVGDYERLCGRPLQSVGILEDLRGTGYTEISSIHLEDFDTALDSEILKLNDRLLNGVIL